MSVARTLLMAAIRGYKRHLSPHKGHGCPSRVRLGLPSCATLGLRALSRWTAATAAARAVTHRRDC